MENNSTQWESPVISQDNVRETGVIDQDVTTNVGSGNMIKYFIIIAIVVLSALTVTAVGVGVYYYNKSIGDSTEGSKGDQEEAEVSIGGESEKEFLDVISPTNNQEINGRFIVEGEATSSLEELTIELYDDNLVLIGNYAIELTSDSTSWYIYMDVTKSPTTLSGKLSVYPTDQGRSSDLLSEVAIKFETNEYSGRVKLFSPLENQILTGTEVLFRGEMKDFFEGTLSIRLKDGSGNVLYSGHITAGSENYGVFASFEETIECGEISQYPGSEGTWEIYEVSTMDGSETVLLSITVRFVE